MPAFNDVPRATTAPATTLLDTGGTSVDLAALWARQPLLLLFLRHEGCAVCRAHLHAVRDSYAAIRARGAEVAAIGPNVASVLAQFAQRNHLPFPLLADPTRRAFAAWGFAEGTLFDALGPHVLMRQAAELLRGRTSSVAPGAPIRQLGGVVIVDRGGRVRFQHQARPIYNYPPVERYLAVLEALHGP